MIGELLQETDWKSPKSLITLHTHYFNNPTTTTIMEARMRKPSSSSSSTMSNEGMMMRDRDREFHNRSSFVSNGNSGKKPLRSSYFSIESMVLLLCLTASLLILPLILPPLPPPPFLLLLLPIGILGLLMILAFMPSNVRDLTYTYM